MDNEINEESMGKLRQHINTCTHVISLIASSVEVELDCIATYEYTPECKGSFQDGLQMEPDESASIELQELVHVVLGAKINLMPLLDQDQYIAIEEAIMEGLC